MCFFFGPTSVARFESSSPCPICPSALPPWPLGLSCLSPASAAPPLPCAAPPADVSPLLSKYQTRAVNTVSGRLFRRVAVIKKQQSRVRLSGWICDGQGDEANKNYVHAFSVNFYSSKSAFQRICNICRMFQKQQLLQNYGELALSQHLNVFH